MFTQNCMNFGQGMAIAVDEWEEAELIEGAEGDQKYNQKYKGYVLTLQMCLFNNEVFPSENK